MLKDCIYTIALFADYKTSVNILCATSLQKDFWENKWKINYPDQTYFDCFTREENYRLKENRYYLTYTHENELVIGSMLNKKDFFTQIQCDVIISLTNHAIEYLQLNLNKYYIVCKNDYYYYKEFYQDDTLVNCYEKIKKANQLNINDDYIIIDVRQLTLKPSCQCIRYEYYNRYNINKL